MNSFELKTKDQPVPTGWITISAGGKRYAVQPNHKCDICHGSGKMIMLNQPERHCQCIVRRLRGIITGSRKTRIDKDPTDPGSQPKLERNHEIKAKIAQREQEIGQARAELARTEQDFTGRVARYQAHLDAAESARWHWADTATALEADALATVEEAKAMLAKAKEFASATMETVADCRKREQAAREQIEALESELDPEQKAHEKARRRPMAEIRRKAGQLDRLRARLARREGTTTDGQGQGGASAEKAEVAQAGGAV